MCTRMGLERRRAMLGSEGLHGDSGTVQCVDDGDDDRSQWDMRVAVVMNTLHSVEVAPWIRHGSSSSGTGISLP
jgi:hypothetical protein